MSGPCCLFDQVSDFARQRAGRTALITGSSRISYGELDDRARRVGNGLHALKLEQQSRVAILCRNRHEFFEIWQGAAMAGHVLSPINAKLAAREIAFILNDSQARLLFVDEAFHGLVQEISGELSAVQQIFTLGSHPQWRSYSDWRDGQSFEEPPRSLLPDDTVVQRYTSGTTGFPKGAYLHHRGITNNARFFCERFEVADGDVFVNPMPLFHTAGCVIATLGPVQLGATLVCLVQFDPALMLELLESEKGTHMLGVPTMLIAVM
ncbi:MAG: AMP-binding protein, partial [Lysobacterales bacterium]